VGGSWRAERGLAHLRAGLGQPHNSDDRQNRHWPLMKSAEGPFFPSGVPHSSIGAAKGARGSTTVVAMTWQHYVQAIGALGLKDDEDDSAPSFGAAISGQMLDVAPPR
jgi:hypothetical protein